MGIRISKLVKIYGSSTIVNQISFEVADGEFVTLLGPSGCGKTTTLRCIAGLERADGGTIEIDGAVVSDGSLGIHAGTHERNLGMVFQSYAIWPHMTVAQNVAFPLQVRGSTRNDAIDEAVRWALDVVGLGALSQRHPSELSGGQQQRVALARAIVGKPKVLLFDEPLSNLDARLRDRTRAEISRIQKDLAIPAVYVTHDQGEALSMSDRVIVMSGGVTVEEGSPRDLYQRPRKRFTAEFIGAANFLAMTWDGKAWKTADGASLAIPGYSSAALGETRQAVLRSEVLHVEAADAPVSAGYTALRGKVLGHQYMGPYTEYSIDVAGATIMAHSSAEFPVASPVHVTFRPQDIHLLAADA